VTRIRAKRPRLRLAPEAYRQLYREVLDRDGWRCQSCGRMENLQVHHIQPRGRLGDDAAENLVALCAECHRSAHNGNRSNSFLESGERSRFGDSTKVSV
jgi:5-methylcytosine-specific restriction endonuclease McrA